jgi:hypothetical protein
MKAQRFNAEILEGHKGAAVIVPFDPAKVWATPPAPVPAPWKTGHPVQGTMNGTPFEGWIGKRWGRFFILVDAALQKRMHARVGDVVAVAVQLRSTGKKASGPAKPKATRRLTTAKRGVAPRPAP